MAARQSQSTHDPRAEWQNPGDADLGRAGEGSRAHTDEQTGAQLRCDTSDEIGVEGAFHWHRNSVWVVCNRFAQRPESFGDFAPT